MIDGSDIERRFLEEKAEIVRGFLQEREIVDRAHEDEKNDMRLAFEVDGIYTCASFAKKSDSTV